MYYCPGPELAAWRSPPAALMSRQAQVARRRSSLRGGVLRGQWAAPTPSRSAALRLLGAGSPLAAGLYVRARSPRACWLRRDLLLLALKAPRVMPPRAKPQAGRSAG